MSTEAKSAERTEVIEEVSKWGVGAGILVGGARTRWRSRSWS